MDSADHPANEDSSRTTGTEDEYPMAIDRSVMKQMLERLFDPDKLEELPCRSAIGLGRDAGEGHHSRDSGRRTSDGTFDAVGEGNSHRKLSAQGSEQKRAHNIPPYEQSHLLPPYAFGRKTPGFCVKRFDEVRILSTHILGLLYHMEA